MSNRLLRSIFNTFASNYGVFIAFGFCAFGSHKCHADLVWKSKEAVADLASPDNAIVTFECYNEGPKAVAIMSTYAGCSCTSVSVSKRHINPKEWSTITAVVKRTSKVGSKSIAVKTDEPDLLFLTIKPKRSEEIRKK
ncbi:MAG: DUF1573 domain-containing protein [Chthoniobacteraceae bacterium]|nr:DUF1573 domain-containing protein [Chthoniobacteraceae bacterium]